MTGLAKKEVQAKRGRTRADSLVGKVLAGSMPKKGTDKHIDTGMFKVSSVGVTVSGKRIVSTFPFTEIYSAQPSDRIKFIKDGVPSDYIVLISKSMGITRERLFTVLGLPKSTIERKITHNQALPPDQGERVLGMAKLVGQVQVMVEQSGDPKGFDAAAWVANWIVSPSPALGGDTPASYLDTSEGQELVSGLIAKMQSGAYA
jgi:putative toxin-antitoxin system antitoxin component (TIGR02293 family)